MRLFGGRPHVGPYVTEEDIKTLVNVGVEQNVLEEEERELIHSIIEFGDTIVREVMTPRTGYGRRRGRRRRRAARSTW